MKAKSDTDESENIPLNILVIEDSEDDAFLIMRELQNGGYKPIFTIVETLEDMINALNERKWDIVISDYIMPKFSGMDALKLLKQKKLDIPFIIVSGNIGEDIAVNAMIEGAHDYIMKDNLSRLIPAVNRELREAEVRKERREAEKALQESEEKFRVLAENVPASIIVYQDDRSIYVNDYAVKSSGYSKEELYSGDIWDKFHPDDQKSIKEMMQARLEGKEVSHRYEARFITKSGEVVWDDISAGSFLYDGKPAGVAMLVDITQRKKAEKAIKESEALYRTIFYNTGAAAIIIGPDTTILLANHSWEKLTGVSKEEQENQMSWTVFIHKDDVEFMKKYHYDRREDHSAAPNIYECRLIDAQKNLHHCIVHVDVIPGTKNSVASLIDLTEVKKAEKALKESEERYKELYENNPSMYFTVNAQGTVLSVNQYGYQQLGYTREELVGQSVLNVFYEKDRKNALKSVKECVDNLGQVYHWELRKVRKNGSIFWVKGSARALRGIGGEIVVFIVCEDITERKMAEDKLKASLDEKEVLLREIHHRVKNNMQIMSSLLRLQSRYIDEKKAYEIFQDSQNRVRSMALIHEKLYKSENLSEIDFEEYIKNLAADLIRSYGVPSNNISLNINANVVSLGVNIAIPCGLIINELLTNSIKYAFVDGRKGVINIELDSINEKEYRLVFSDNGVGLSEDFEFENSRTLGLRLVKSLTKQLKGKIELKRENGTKFIITFIK